MTLLSISQDVFDEVQIVRQDSIVGNNAEDAQRMLRYVNKVGRRLMEIYPWENLRREQTFSALNQETQTGILASDFDRMVPETFWNTTEKVLISGPIPAVRWRSLKVWDYTGFPRFFTYRGGDLLMLPAPTAGDSLVFEYITNQWCESSGGTGQTAMAADTDVARIDEELITLAVIYNWLAAEGQPSEDAKMDLKEKLATLTDNEEASDEIMMAGDMYGQGGRRFTGEPHVANTNSLLVI